MPDPSDLPRSDARLSTTSYAILGLLAIQPWSTYELAKLMRRSLDRIWPRVESGLYEEPRKLERAGYATSEVLASGRRTRTEYRITEAGAAALRGWLADPTIERTSFECAPLVQVYFGNCGAREDILAAIERIRRGAELELRHWISVASDYAVGRGRFVERIHVNAVMLRLVWELAMTRLAWAEWATSEVSTWTTAAMPDDAAHFEALIGQVLASAPAGIRDLQEAGGSAT